jgi:hypothetical protein
MRGLTAADLYPRYAGNGKSALGVTATYRYLDEQGDEVFQVVRLDGKKFRQRRPDGAGQWIWNIKGVRRVPYRLPELIEAVAAGRESFVVEGEKDAETLRGHGLVATCNPGGAGKWRQEYCRYLDGATVVILPDADEPGRRHAAHVAQTLQGIAASVRVVELPGLHEHGDVTDWLNAGHTLSELQELVNMSGQRAISDDATSMEDGAALLDDVTSFLGRYVVFPSSEARDAVVLWVVHTHALDAADSTPRLALLSPEKGSGKTRLLEVIEMLVPTARHAVNMTAAAMFRALEADQPTLLFDEADSYFGAHAAHEHEDLRALVNAGHRRGAEVYRVVGPATNMITKAFPAFAAVALAGIGDLPDTILDRAVLVRMRRRAPDEQVEPFRARKVRPEGDVLRQRLARWTNDRSALLSDADPEMPPGITDRAADVWEPLVAIGDAAGGDWPIRARNAAVVLNGERLVADPSFGVRLLVDIRSAFDEDGADRLTSTDLVTRLCAGEETPWGDLRGKALDPRGLARRLKPYGIRPGQHRFGHDTGKGYLRSDFTDAWNRYLPPAQGGETTETSETPAGHTTALTGDVSPVSAVSLPADGEGEVSFLDEDGNLPDAEAIEIVERVFGACEVLLDDSSNDFYATAAAEHWIESLEALDEGP